MNADLRNGVLRGGLLFYGSSSMRLWTTLTEDFAPLPVLNRGFGGALLPDLIYYADQVLSPHSPDEVIFYAGGNDIFSGKSQEQLEKNISSFYDKFVEILCNTPIYFVSILPHPYFSSYHDDVIKFNDFLESFSVSSASARFVDACSYLSDASVDQRIESFFQSDQIHLNTTGYALLRAAILDRKRNVPGPS